MHITKVELENIKSHADSTFEFTRGTTAITGPNGAGKTTIIEAIAWTMFDLLDYKKDEFRRRGAKKGYARVSFISGLDEREYTIHRDTGNGYHVFDPAIEERVADKKEDVGRFLRQHLGVGSGTDLESLFRHAVGVPQGTLTAIFLSAPAERKRTFDVLLKVEEYRAAAEELLKTQRFVESSIAELNNLAHRGEGELIRYDEVTAELRQARELLAGLSAELGSLRENEVAERSRLDEFERKEKVADAARKEKDRVEAELSRAKLLCEQAEAEFERSRTAAEKIGPLRIPAERHMAANARLVELERERTERDRLKEELAKIATAENSINVELKHIKEGLEEIERARGEMATLESAVEEQMRIEKKIGELRETIAEGRGHLERVAELDSRLERLRKSFAQSKAELEDARKRSAGAEKLGDLEYREHDLMNRMARQKAQLERDERFQEEIRNGLCPILSERCLNMKEGQTLESFLKGQFEELRSEIKLLEREHAGIRRELEMTRLAEIALGKVPMLERNCAEIEAEGTRIRAERDEIDRRSATRAETENELRSLEHALARLDDPKGRSTVLREKLEREAELRNRVTNAESNTERLESERNILVEQMERYAHLDEQLAAAADERNQTADDRRRFIALEQAAKDLPERQAAFERARGDVREASSRLSLAADDHNTAALAYNGESHIEAREKWVQLQKETAAAEVRLQSAEVQQKRLEEEVERLSKIREALAATLAKRERKGKLLETTVFIRDTLKEAAPLVARNYVFHVSAEANLLFREITGDAERTLRWAEDYGIFLEEGGFERPFQSLSGGEQMAAALSVRLALLKQLSDIRIAFFDEPTANMDAERRENLAMQIGQITHFDQLFVISHDDTFEGYLDHEIRLEK